MSTTLRCAIYTRVSSDQGLEQDFNSLHAQREAAEAYIKSQAHEGWKLHRESYDDGGFSGGSMDRPALQRLLKDLAGGRIDIIVVYKVDRLTRSLADFAKLIEIFDANKVSFVSVTQSFNTTSSMGRLTLNVLLSFAQFEREVTGERIRDKIAASKKKGLWMGGVVPLGYRVENRKLIVNEAEAETVRLIFRRYLDLGSVRALQRDLLDRGIRTRSRTLASGKVIGGIAFTNGPLNHLLKNRMYLGDINHHGVSYPSDHPPILTLDLFEAVQAQLATSRNYADPRKGKSDALLKGRFFNDGGSRMSPARTMKKGVRYNYYISTPTVQGRASDPGSIRRVSAKEVETIVLNTLQTHGVDLSPDNGNIAEAVDLRVIILSDTLDVSWVHRAEANHTARIDTDAVDDERRHVIVPFVAIRRKHRREIHLPVNKAGYVQPIPEDQRQSLVLSIARGKAWLREVLKRISTDAIATREGKSERAIRLTLSLAFLDPMLVKAALQGSLPRGVSTRRLLDAPVSWHNQWRALGLARPA